MTFSYPEKVLPGQPILPIYQKKTTHSIKYITGENVRLEGLVFNNQIVPTIIATTLGRVIITDSNSTDNDEEADYVTKIISVIPKNDPRYNAESQNIEDSLQLRKFKATTPKVGDLVLARVTRMTNSRINVEILNISKDLYVPSQTDEDNKEAPVRVINQKKQDELIKLTNLLPTENGEFFKGTIRSQDVRSTDRDSVKTWECFQPDDIIRALVISLGDGVSYYLTTAREDLGVIFARNESGEILYPLDWESMIAPGTGSVEKRKCAKP